MNCDFVSSDPPPFWSAAWVYNSHSMSSTFHTQEHGSDVAVLVMPVAGVVWRGVFKFGVVVTAHSR